MKKILVANRGEIALSALRCIREMGLRSVAVYSQPDEQALHVRFADEVRSLPGARSLLNYASIDRILQAAESTGADTVYCGYGFLSESPEFARACRDRGIVFVGPAPEVLESCRDKLHCFEQAGRLGIPIPAHSGIIQDEDDLVAKAHDLGYPLLLKPVSGTGGRSITKVYRKEDLLDSYRGVVREQMLRNARSTFYLEKYIRNAAHIEFPVLADQFGTIRHLGERECVVQRRFQKLISETPSLRLADAPRRQMGEAALAMARELHFVGCGAVEFMIDDKGKWYFMEINPRLQVEYALTEVAYGVELIKEQLRIAAGERLNLAVDANPQPRFHAIECRVNAEDVARDFQPSAGVVTEYYLPGGYGYSVLSSTRRGHRIDIYYDPMVLKIVCFGANRPEALIKAGFALDAIRLKGVKTNIPFLRRIVSSEEFQTSTMNCDFKLKEFLASDTSRERQEVAAIVAALDHEVLGRFRSASFRREAPASNVWSMSGRLDMITRRNL
jgi:acetyl/propionyl-CoA carboxylase alpha subunit